VKFEFNAFQLERDYNFEDKIVYKKDGTPAGELTSKTYSLKLKTFVALGILSKKLKYEELNELYIKENSDLIKVEKIKLPMIDL